MDAAPNFSETQDDGGAALADELQSRLTLTSASQGRPPSGHHFENTTTCENARAHYGNHYGEQHHYYYATQPEPSPLPSEEVNALKRLQEALCFPQMNLRFTSIQAAYSQTCQWLFGTREYTRWRDLSFQQEHHGLLWMKGKPGAGKSTITKCAVEHAKANYTDERVIYFFFNARGQKLEKSVEGMFRSLLYQMALGCPSLLENVQSEALPEYSQRGWPLALLQSLFREAAFHLGRKGPLICYIDAIDEGADEEEVRDMIGFLEDLLETTVGNGLGLSVYLASRHYPNISVSSFEEFVLDDNKGHHGDIASYTQNKLRCKQRSLKDNLVTEIIQRSSGVFLWVILAVRDLNKEIDAGNQHRLQSRLRALPIELSRLFRGIVDETNKDDRLLPALMWVLFSFRAMTPLEVYFAILSSIDLDSRPSIVWNDEADNEVAARHYILSSSKGLLEIVEDQGGPFVQFMHESVREYLLSSGMQQLDSTLGEDIVGRSNARLARWCENHLRLFSDERLIQVDGPYETFPLDRAKRLLPFSAYAVDGFFYHKDKAALHGLDVPLSLEHILFPWLLFRGTTMKQGQCLPTPLHILACCGTAILIKQHLQQCSLNNLQDYVNEPYPDKSDYYMRGTALHIAIRRQLIDNVKLLLDYGADVNIPCAGCQLPLHTVDLYGPFEDVEMMKVLLERGAHVDACDDFGITFLNHALALGKLDAMAVLLKAKADVNAKDSHGHTPLHVAAAGNSRSDKMVGILLQHGADPSARNDRGETALHVAASCVAGQCQRPGTVEILLRHGADPDARSNQGETALHSAARPTCHGTAVVETLLRYGVDPRARNDQGETALHLAAGRAFQKGTEVLEVLMRCGADPSARNDRGETALHLGAYREWVSIDVVEKVLQWNPDSGARHESDTVSLLYALDLVPSKADRYRSRSAYGAR